MLIFQSWYASLDETKQPNSSVGSYNDIYDDFCTVQTMAMIPPRAVYTVEQMPRMRMEAHPGNDVTEFKAIVGA